MAQNQRAGAQPVGERVVVRGKDGSPVVHEAGKKVCGIRSQARVRLIEDQKAWVVQDGAADGQALLHASGKLSCAPVRDTREADRRQRLIHS